MAAVERFRQVKRYADVHGFLAGFPNFHQADYDSRVVYGAVFLRETEGELRSVPRSEYQVFDIEDVPGLFRAANDYAIRHGYPAAFPACEQSRGEDDVAYGTVLLKPGTTERRNVPRIELRDPAVDDVPAMMRAASDYAAREGFAAGFPTFHHAESNDGAVYGMVLLKQGVSTWRNVPADLLAKYNAPSQLWAVLLCNLNDRPPTPTSRDRYVQFFTEAGAGTESAFDYWHDMSYGISGLRETQVFGFIQISHSSAELMAIGGSAQRQLAFQWGIDASRQAGVPVDSFDHKIVLLNGGGNDHGKTVGGVTFVYADATPLEPTFMFHELGHEFGLDHSFSDQPFPCALGDARPGAYCDTSDIMSAMNVASFLDALGRRSGPSLNAVSRERLGWLDSSRVRSLPIAGPEETMALAAVNRPDADGYQMIKFNGTSRADPTATSMYTVEFREQTGWDRGLSNSQAIVHEVRADGLVRTLAANPIGVLRGGDQFSSPPPSVVVQVEAIDSSSHAATVRIILPELSKTVAVAPLGDGRLQVWAATRAGRLFSTWKTSTNPDAGWTAWEDFFGEVGGLPGGATNLAVAPLEDGRLQLWATTGNGGLFSTWKTSTNPDAGWTAWEDFFGEVGGLPGGATNLAVAPLEDGRLQLWATTGNGGLFSTWKTSTNPDAGWTAWEDFFGEVGGLPGGATNLAVAPLEDGRLQLWATTGNGGLFSTWKTSTNPDAGWTAWEDFFGEVGGLPGGATNLAVAPLEDGRLQLWATTGNGGLFSTWKTSTNPDAGWTAWEDFFGEVGGLPGGATNLAVAPLEDGRLQLWATTGNGGLFSTWKTSTNPDAGWTVWEDLFG